MTSCKCCCLCHLCMRISGGKGEGMGRISPSRRLWTPSPKKKMLKMSHFGKFVDFCPLRNAFCPSLSPHKKKKKKKNLVPPLMRIVLRVWNVFADFWIFIRSFSIGLCWSLQICLFKFYKLVILYTPNPSKRCSLAPQLNGYFQIQTTCYYHSW